VIPHLIDSGRTLTFTAEEALQWGYCDGLAESTDEVITRYLDCPVYTLESYRPSWLDNLRGFLMNPFLQSLLILIIVGGIYFELQTPGVGFPLVAAIVAAVLYFSPLYVEGLAANWEILLFVLGVLLLALEIFVIPGFGVAGISGMALVMAGFILALLNNVSFRFDGVSSAETGRAVLTVCSGLVLGMTAMLGLSHRIGRRGLLRRMALNADLEDAVAVPEFSGLAGREGVAATVLRPSGKVAIDGEWYDGISESGFIEKGAAVRVVRFENAQVYVTPVRDSGIANK
jgi:membrane-bound serine protease (ClpP class)